jgi:prolyl 4-hydroxylase
VTIPQSAAAVRESLRSNPAAVEIPGQGLELFALANFLTGEECDGLIALIDAGRKPSGILADDPDPEFRTSESCDLAPRDPLVQRIEAKVAGVIGLDPTHGETIQGQRYAPGQQFKPHHDFFHTGQSYWPAQQAAGGQRTWTAMIFLNVPAQGGQTVFPDAKVKINPRRGTLLAWNNLGLDGNPNPKTLHAGAPVVEGVKYIITKWYRERPWTPHLVPGAGGAA